MRLILLVVACCSAGLMAVQRDETDADAAAMAALVGRYVEQYYARAQSVLVDERVTLQRMSHGMAFEGLPRRLIYELRIEWNPTADPEADPASIVRELVRAGGPALGPPDQPDCLDPRAVSPEPLAFLLPERQEKYTFRTAGTATVRDRDVVRLDFLPRRAEPPIVDWEGSCGHIELPGRMRGRLWVDPDTGEILRFDEHLVGLVDIPGPDQRRRPDLRRWFTIERADTSVRYEPISFENPDETFLLAVQIESMTIIRNSGVPRLRTTRTFTNYRRFLTESRLITD